MPVVSAKAKARIAAMFTVITPLQRCLELATTLWGCRLIKNKQTIAIAVKYPMRSAAIHSATWNDAAGTGEKLCPTSQQRLGRNGIIPGPQVAKRKAQQSTHSPRLTAA
jgi:hypothetical protein